ncbi:ribosome maturation factor RimP [Rubrobacter indicoceani]|uniref:ribosome maturation factor RimP n=1 Tax=Rubrobacter indicoceani TaxID=2051957 RepID=UPI0013C41180|nr:ribosome maturation factor RimP [Rubrobacter indicoceani]
MVETASLERLSRVVEEALPEGAELVEARFSGGPLLTLLIDNLRGSVDHEFTVRISRAISPALEGEGYDGMVEVSSPGIERPLTKPSHFERFTGHEARVRTSEAVDGTDGRRKFAGVIAGAGKSDFTLKLEDDGSEIAIDYANVTRAILKEDLDK